MDLTPEREAQILPENRILMEVIGPQGDVKKLWDKTKPDEVEDAKRSFEALTKKGYSAFLVKDEEGNKGERMKEFDGQSGRMILVPPVIGG